MLSGDGSSGTVRRVHLLHGRRRVICSRDDLQAGEHSRSQALHQRTRYGRRRRRQRNACSARQITVSFEVAVPQGENWG